LLDFLQWLKDLIDRALRAIEREPATAAVVKWAVFTLVAILIVTIGYRLFRHYREARGDAAVRFKTAGVADLWKESERAARRGDYTEAAHLLYAALVRTLVLQGAVRFHSSKTTGEYARELQRRGGPLVAPFTEFVKAYEVVVYRDGTCDADRYAALRHLAEPIVRPRQMAA
jgi:hypothetical protein